MNIASLLLGHFDSNKPFYVYRIEDTSTLLFKLEDVCSFFNLPHSLETQSVTIYVDKQQPNNVYLTSTDLGTLAIKHKKFLLAELCKLKPNDYAANLAEAILCNFKRFERNTVKKDNSQYKSTGIELIESFGTVKSEPLSPPPLLPSTSTSTSDPMAIDTMLTHGGAGSLTRRLSRTNLTTEEQPNKKHKKNEVVQILPKPIHTVSSQKAPPTLLSKRLAQQQSNGKNMRNLTIYTPAYGEQLSTGIKSAPLNSNFRQQMQQQQGAKAQQQHHQQQPHPLSRPTLLSPASSTATSTEFAIPPIVPSQQQPPHTAHPNSKHFPPHSPQYPSSAFGHSFPVTSGRVIMDSSNNNASSSSSSSINNNNNNNNSNSHPPKTPTSHSFLLQKQQFMQPFEHLFDTIETTRTLKSTLDDQIRRSSTLLQTLQASSSTIEGLVRNQIKEVQRDMLHRMEDSLDRLFERITALERKANIEVDVESTTIKSSKESLVHPPTIVKSQHDVNPNEYHLMLETLKERLDKLERQLEDS